MSTLLLNILVIGVALGALFRGWRSGAGCQLPPMIGWSIGIITARLTLPYLCPLLADGGMEQRFTDGDLAAQFLALTLTYWLTSLLFSAVTYPLSRILSVIGTGFVGSLAGALLCLLRWLTLVSLLLNLWGAVDEQCLALRIADGGDGGVIEEVMHIGPILTGAPDYPELLHRRQLREARKISQNLLPSPCVINNTSDGTRCRPLYI